MTNRSKQKGTRFESEIASYMSEQLGCEVERRALCGAEDRGDLAGVSWNGNRVVVECKSHKELRLSQWLREAEAERSNDGAALGVVVAKRRGTAKPSEQYAILTLESLCDLLKGEK